MKPTSFKKKSLSPLISTILLVVVAVILVSLVLSFGKNFVSKNLDETKGLENLSASDATYFIHSKTIKNGILQFNYLPPENLKDKKLTITSYTVLEIPKIQEPIFLKEQQELVPGINIIELTGLYAYSTTSPDLTIQLITSNNTFLNFNVTEPGMVCVTKGNGSEEDPKIICTAEDLNKVRDNLSGNYALGKDIDLYHFSRKDVNGWEPIGKDDGSPTYPYAFKGNFDGKNHSIINLYINRSSTNYVGLFGYTRNATFNNVLLRNVDINGNDNVGSLTAYSLSGNFFNCSSTGNVSGRNTVGGLISYEFGGTIKNCSFSGNVFGEDDIGGFASTLRSLLVEKSYSNGTVVTYNGHGAGFVSYANLLDGGIIRNCYSRSSVSGKYVSGFVYELGDDEGFSSVEFKNSYSAGNVFATGNQHGGLIGFLYSTITLTNCFYDQQTSGQNDTGKGDPKTTAEMKTQSTFTGWDFDNIWNISPSINDGYPYLKDNPPPN